MKLYQAIVNLGVILCVVGLSIEEEIYGSSVVIVASNQRQGRLLDSDSNLTNTLQNKKPVTECGMVKIPSLDHLQKKKINYMDRPVPTDIAETPWMVTLIMKSSQDQGQKMSMYYRCQGVLIDDIHVLTTTTCVHNLKSDDVDKMKAYIGDHRMKDENTNKIINQFHVVRKIKKIAYHRDFNSITFKNNIALVTLAKSVNFTSTIQPVCLSDGDVQYDEGNTIAILNGWKRSATRPMKALYKEEIRVWNNGECEGVYDERYFPRISESEICAGSSTMPGLCRGNNGAPLVIRTKNHYELIGLSSWGLGNASNPCVFTRIEKFLYWIQKNKST